MNNYGVLIKSDRAILAESNGRYPMTYAKKHLRDELKGMDIKSTLYGCELLLKEHGDFGEWHHSSKFAREIDYYDVNAVIKEFDENLSEALQQMAVAKKPKKEEVKTEARNVKLKYRVWITSSRYRVKRYEGPATIKGDWIHFQSTKKKLTGDYIEVEYLDSQMVAK
ncbi:hypothetical protein [Gimesia chilikensis]|uniref:Uncharacterized protein n=1 Tax=Gimesia chilikensis TaxID=2605989 RepID=A0A517PY90_9PLAN|nr:hypothetical protein [Gimesia chilikensis]QDT24343.1 hypothetical protein HG66A1_61750 [Gimesia chilikensis]